MLVNDLKPRFLGALHPLKQCLSIVWDMEPYLTCKEMEEPQFV